MGDIVMVVAGRFPWIQKIYSKMLSVETTAEILKQSSVLTPLISAESAFVKLIEYWSGIAEIKYQTPVSELISL